MTFSFTGTAVVRHVNLRKEGATDAKNVMADIKLEAIAPSRILHPFNPALEPLLFTPAGEPRIVNLAPIHLEGSIKHLACNFPEWQVELRDVEAKKFHFEPMSGHRVTMTFSIAIEPRGQQTTTLAEMLGEAVQVTIGVEADLFAHDPDAVRFNGELDALVSQAKAAESKREGARAMHQLNDLLAEHGATAKIVDSAGDVLATLPGHDLEGEKLYQDAVRLVREQLRPSISYLQRRYAIRYNAAAALLERMEKEGVVSPPLENGARTVLPVSTQPDTAKPTSRKVQPKTAKAETKATGEKPAGKCWTAEELLARIPPAKDGSVLVLRAIGPRREEMIELRINALDDRGQRVQVGYECDGKGSGGTYTAPVKCRDRGMLEDAIHDTMAEIRGRYDWKHLANEVKGWPLSKTFRNVGVKAI